MQQSTNKSFNLMAQFSIYMWKTFFRFLSTNTLCSFFFSQDFTQKPSTHAKLKTLQTTRPEVYMWFELLNEENRSEVRECFCTIPVESCDFCLFCFFFMASPRSARSQAQRNYIHHENLGEAHQRSGMSRRVECRWKKIDAICDSTRRRRRQHSPSGTKIFK